MLVLLVLATVAAFWPVTRGDFINYDDPDYVTANPRVLQGLHWQGVAWAFRTTHANNWHPLTWLSHMLDCQLFGKDPTGPHAVNLLLHLANTILVFLLLSRATGAHWPSVWVAGIFALHPLHVESVAWVAERKDLLSSFFGLMALVAYVKYTTTDGAPLTRSQDPAGNTTVIARMRNPDYIAALVLFACALLSKPMLVTLPCLMLLLDYWPLGRFGHGSPRETPARLLLAEKLPFLLLSGVSCVVTAWVQRHAMPGLVSLTLSQRVGNALVAYSRYLAKAFWPVDLGLPYPHPGQWPTAVVILAALVVGAVCAGAWLGRKRWPFAFTGWFWFVGMLVPVIGLVQVGNQSMADRYAYLPLIGLSVLVAWAAGEGLMRTRLQMQLAGALAITSLALLAGRTWHQAGYWRSSDSLFRHTLAVTSNNYVALENLGVSLFERGLLDQAIDCYRRSLQIRPDFAEALNSLGAALSAQGSDQDIDYFRRALEINPANADALFNLGNALARKNQHEEAIRCYESALQLNPERYEAGNNMANVLLQLGRAEEAIHYYRLALQWAPRDPKLHRNLGGIFLKEGKAAEAAEEFRAALAQQSQDAATHYSLGLALALQKRWDGAVHEYLEALRLAPANPEAEYNLGYALRMQGRLPESAVHLREALRLKPTLAIAHYNLGCVLADQDQRQQAEAHWREALRLEPDYEQARQKLQSPDGATPSK